jgi:hypothetical protein
MTVNAIEIGAVVSVVVISAAFLIAVILIRLPELIFKSIRSSDQ